MALTGFTKSRRIFPLICQLLKAGEVIALPTETAYGLTADATNSKAVAKIIRLKGRKSNKPIALMAADLKTVKKFFKMTSLELRLANKFWPGPLTLLLKPKKKFPKAIIGSGGFVGVRVPGDKWLRELLSNFGKPLTATSANISGEPVAYSAQAVKKFLAKKGLKYLVDGGILPRRPTSTVVKINKRKVEIIRTGAIAQQQIINVIS